MDNAYNNTRSLRDMAVNERPQERLEKNGPTALSDTELLAMLLRSGTQGVDVLALSSQLIAQAGSLAGLLRYTDADFRELKGIGRIKALQLITVMEIARRVLRAAPGESPRFENPADVLAYMAPIVAGLDIEKFYSLLLNRKNRLIKHVEVTSGTATSSLSHPREVFREAIRSSATAIICVHNHPSGDPAPSPADIRCTRQLRESANIVGIDLSDHIIVGTPHDDPYGKGYYSFAEAGML